MLRRGVRCGGWICIFLIVAAVTQAADFRFQVTFAEQVHRGPFSGRVYLFFSKQQNAEPRRGPDWFRPEPIAAVDIDNWNPGEPLTFAPGIRDWMLAFPRPLSEMDLAGYRVQAVARFNPFERRVGNGPGNGYSAVVEPANANGRLTASLTIDKLVEPRAFPENQWCKLLAVRSARLSEFHGRDVELSAAVLLPASYYDQPERRYPVIFTVPGFGGTHFEGVRREPIAEQNEGGVQFIRVTLDPSCPLGHHVFADSANNGPVGAALIEEFIPELDRRYRTVASASGRFLTGHSSGGWSTLWLQVTYPGVFGGVWSTAPDPVDFRDFQRIDLYWPGENMYRDRAGNRRPLARRGDQPFLWYDDFDRMEEVLGPGGQLHSFEAVFSPRGPDGKPLRVWSRKTGEIDTAAARLWQKYDLRLILQTDWDTLKPQLAGKLHVIMGELDTFYLDGATRLLKESLARLGSDAVVELVPGKDHSTLLSSELTLRIRAEMVRAHLAQTAAGAAPR